jgi:hypothetical protein
MTGRLADHRNSLVAALSKQLFVPLASPGGKIEGLCLELLRAGKRVLTLDESNKALISAGAEVVEPVAM